MHYNYRKLLKKVRSEYYANITPVDDRYVNNVSTILRNNDVISFDIFDTLITRLFECPIDLFACVAGILEDDNIQLEEFAIRRVEAEENARQIARNNFGKEEVTFEEIYRELKNIYPNQDEDVERTKEIELDVEFQSLVELPDNIEVISRARQLGKKIIFTSDIYLDEDFIKKILLKLDIYFDELYVSSEINYTKSTGNIWNIILKNNLDKKILHIGDNYDADVLIPKKYGINTYSYPRFRSERRFGGLLSTNIVPFSLLQKIQMLEKTIDTSDEKNKFWSDLGNTFGVMILKSFCDWLAEKVKTSGINHIYFCARDAQIIQKAWGVLGYDDKLKTTSSYLYVSRQALRIPTCYAELKNNGLLSENSLNFLTYESVERGDTYKKYFGRLKISEDILKLNSFEKKIAPLNSEFDYSKVNLLKIFFQKDLKKILLEQLQEQYENTIGYLYQEEVTKNNDKKKALVDLGWTGTITLSINKLSGFQGNDFKTSSFYYGLFNVAAGRLYINGIMESCYFDMFDSPENNYQLTHSINILENLHSADNESIIGYKKDKEDYIPSFANDNANINKYLVIFNKTFKVFQESALVKLRKLKEDNNLYGVNINYFQSSYARSSILQVCISPNELERKYLGKIQHSRIHFHSDYYKLIPELIPTSLEEVDKIMNNPIWETGVLLYWKTQVSKFDPKIYQLIKERYNYFPTFIKKGLFA